MTTTLTPDAAEAAAQKLLSDRVKAVRVLAETRQNRTIARAQLDEAERADAAAYAAAQRAGWTPEELRKLGLEESNRRVPGRPRGQRTAHTNGGRSATGTSGDSGAAQ